MAGSKRGGASYGCAFALLAGIAVVVALVPVARAHGEGAALFEGAQKVLMPFSETPPSIDGAIQSGEYSAFGAWEEEGFELFLEHNESLIYVAILSPGEGWAGVAFSSDVDAGANVILVNASGSAAEISDNFAPNVTDEMDSEPDVALGGVSDITAFAAASSSTNTVYEFAIPLSSPDTLDQQFGAGSIYPLVVAFNETAQTRPAALAEGDIHFLQVYVARAQDDLAAIQEIFMGEISPVPALVAMASLSVGVGVLVWRYVLASREEAT